MQNTSAGDYDPAALRALLDMVLLRKSEAEGLTKLPRLSSGEEAALQALGPESIQELLAECGLELSNKPEEAEAPQEELALAGVGEDFVGGLNRAEKPNEEDEKELKRKRLELLERLKKEKARKKT